jgi:hypothetical protein
MTMSGMMEVSLDTQGRLLRFEAVPPQVNRSETPAAAAFDWNLLLRAAGLDVARFTPTEPQWLPPSAFDARAAWAGSYAHAPSIPIRVEAAAWRGRPVFFELIGPWSVPARMQPAERSSERRTVEVISMLIQFVVFGIAALLAWWN